MAAHVFLRTTAPSSAPTEIGNHWIDTVNKIEYFSVGTSSVADWVSAAGAPVVTSIFGRTGVVVAQTGDYTTPQITEAGDKFFISAADLALIGSSAQPGDNISIFVNDAGYITAAGAPVQSVNGQTGTVVLDADDIDDTSTTNKFATQAQLNQIATNQTDITNLENNSISAPVNSGLVSTGTLGGTPSLSLDIDNLVFAFIMDPQFDRIAYLDDTDNNTKTTTFQFAFDLAVPNNTTITNNINNISANTAAIALKYDASNPNGYETPAQLDARDVADRNRANHTGTQLASTISDFTEAAQDAVGTSLVDSASVDFTYDDVANTITADVLPAGVNHNALQNYVFNEHIDHSTVSIDAGTGLTGGGDITTTRTISMPNVGIADTYGSAADVPVFTTDAQGRVSSVTDTPIQIAQSQVIDLITDLTNKANVFDPNIESYLFDDFYFGLNTDTGWLVTVVGTGSSLTQSTYGVDSTEKAVGVVSLNTGTTNTGRCGLNRLNNGISLGYKMFDVTWRVAFDTLADVTDVTISYIGLLDNLGAGISIDGVFFGYNFSISPNWLCFSRSNNVQTLVITTIPVTTSFFKLRILINSNATEASFFINNVLATTITTNIPTGIRFTGIGTTIRKSNGTASRSINVDYYEHKIEIPGGRD